MRPLKIVHTLPFFYPAIQFGGPVTQAAALCRHLAQRGHRVQVVTTDIGIDADLPRDAWVPLDGYQVWYTRARCPGRFAPYLVPGIRKPLESAVRDANVLHLHVGLTYTNAVARRVANACRVPYVYTPHGVLSPVVLRKCGLAKAAFLRLFERQTIRGAAALQPVTIVERDHLLRQGACELRTFTIPNGVDRIGHGDADRHSDRLDFRREFRIQDEALVVLFLGQLAWVKGLDLLIAAVARVRRQVPGVCLVLAGPDHGYGARARSLVRRFGLENATRFPGLLGGPLKRKAFCAADVFVLSSYSEGLPIAVLEACEQGIPVVITDRCNLPEIVEYRAGRIEPPTVNDLATALLQILSDGMLRVEMGAQAMKMVAERFSIVAITRQIEAIYRHVIRAADRARS